MITYFILAHCTFMTNFSSKLKSQFQLIFDEDSFPLKMSPFQVSLLQNFTNCLLDNGWWNTCFYHYFFFCKKVPHLVFASAWFVSRYFSFVEQTDFVVFPDYSPVFPDADSASYDGYMQNGTLCKYLIKFIQVSKKHKKNLS